MSHAYSVFETADPIDLGQTLRDAAIHLRKVAEADAVEHESPDVAYDRNTVADLIEECGGKIEAVVGMIRMIRRRRARAVVEA